LHGEKKTGEKRDDPYENERIENKPEKKDYKGRSRETSLPCGNAQKGDGGPGDEKEGKPKTNTEGGEAYKTNKGKQFIEIQRERLKGCWEEKNPCLKRERKTYQKKKAKQFEIGQKRKDKQGRKHLFIIEVSRMGGEHRRGLMV